MAKDTFKFNLKLTKKSASFLFFITSIFIGLSAATQTFAKYVGYAKQLGIPLFYYKEIPIYNPTNYINWSALYREHAPNADHKASMYLFASIFIGLLSVVAANRKKVVLSSHGTAQWASKEDIVKAKLLMDKEETIKNFNHSNMLETYRKNIKDQEELYSDGVVLGRDDYGREIIHNGPEHIMVMAPTRSGKGVGVIIPTLLTWKGSCIVNDIKGENWALTAPYRKSIGQIVLKFEPTAEFGSCSYNPLTEIRKGKPQEYQDARIIADIIISPDPHDHWGPAGVNFLTGMILHAIYCKENASISDVIRFINAPGNSFEEKMEQIKTFDHNQEPSKPDLFHEIYDDVVLIDEDEFPYTHPIVARMAADMLSKADKERSGIVSTVMTKLGPFTDPIIGKNTSRSDFKMKDLMNFEKPISLYFITPPKAIQITGLILRLIIAQAIYNLTDEMKFNGNENRNYLHRLLFLIDELPAIGRLDLLEKALAYIAGYGLKALLITQDINQLNKIYTKDNSVLSNCHISVFYTPNDPETPTIIEKKLGQSTIEVLNKSWKGFKYFSDWNYSESQIARSLMTTGEISQLSADRSLIFITGEKPILGHKIRYYKEKKYTNRQKGLIFLEKSDTLYAI